MKRNITVNIFGMLFQMDEDAYAMLNAYILNMRDYFSRRPDGKEIADDIEARAAELMSELTQQGVAAISIEHVDDIIRRIGSPEQMNYDETDEADGDANASFGPATPPEFQEKTKRKLYRNLTNKILGGVCSGVASYFNISAIWIRILCLLLIWPTCGIIIPIYLVCWMMIQPAKTPAERLQMKGEPINFTSLRDEFMSSARSIMESGEDLARSSGVSRGIASAFKWVMYTIGGLLLAFSVMAILGIIISVVCAIATPWEGMRSLLGNDFPILMIIDSNPLWLLSLCSISILVLLAVTLFMLVHVSLHILQKVNAMSSGLRIACVSVWAVALIALCATSASIAGNTSIKHAPSRAQREAERAKFAAERKAQNLAYLEDGGWTLAREKNLETSYTRTGGHYSDNGNIRYLHGHKQDDGMDMEYEVVKTLKVAPGIYRLEAAGRTNGEGAEIFASTGANKRYAALIPVCGGKGGEIWHEAKIALDADTAEIRADRDRLNKIVNANDGQGYGWSKVVVDSIVVGNDSIITYGVTNYRPGHSWEGTWLSASSFELEKK